MFLGALGDIFIGTWRVLTRSVGGGLTCEHLDMLLKFSAVDAEEQWHELLNEGRDL
jgi:hypothetical protein